MDSPQRRDSFFGALAEPHVSRAVLEGMLGEQPTIEARRRTVLLGAEATAGVLRAIRLRGPRGEESLAGRVFIDGSYEGDLAAAAGFSFRVGRESTREYGERFAGHIYFQDGRILDGSTGAGDGKIQCYNFRVVMTEDPANAAPLPMPPDYGPERYERILEEVRAGRIQHPVAEAKTGVRRLRRLPNGKADRNDVNTSLVGFGLPGQNWDYPMATPARRAEIGAAVFSAERAASAGGIPGRGAAVEPAEGRVCRVRALSAGALRSRGAAVSGRLCVHRARCDGRPGDAAEPSAAGERGGGGLCDQQPRGGRGAGTLSGCPRGVCGVRDGAVPDS